MQFCVTPRIMLTAAASDYFAEDCDGPAFSVPLSPPASPPSIVPTQNRSIVAQSASRPQPMTMPPTGRPSILQSGLRVLTRLINFSQAADDSALEDEDHNGNAFVQQAPKRQAVSKNALCCSAPQRTERHCILNSKALGAGPPVGIAMPPPSPDASTLGKAAHARQAQETQDAGTVPQLALTC